MSTQDVVHVISINAKKKRPQQQSLYEAGCTINGNHPSAIIDGRAESFLYFCVDITDMRALVHTAKEWPAFIAQLSGTVRRKGGGERGSHDITCRGGGPIRRAWIPWCSFFHSHPLFFFLNLRFSVCLQEKKRMRQWQQQTRTKVGRSSSLSLFRSK